MKLFKGKDELTLTDGSVLKPLVYLSLPIVITNLLQTAYNLADTFWLGQYSEDALAGITFAFPLVFLLISLGMGISVAGSVLVAQHTGAGDPRKAEYTASQTVSFAFLGSALLGILGYPLIRPIIALLGASPSVLPGATAYMQIIALGLPFMFGFFVFTALMRGSGDTVTPMFVMLGTVILNIILDPFLIYGWTVVPDAPLVGTIGFPELGIQGAAIATVVSRTLAMAVGIVIMLSGTRGIAIRPTDMVPDVQYLRKLLRIGVPASVEGLSRALSINALLVVVGLFPTPIVAAYGVGTRVFSVIFLPAIAVARGVETMSGQNIGAGKYDRAKRANYLAAKAMFGILSVAGILVFLFPRPVVAAFSDNPAVVDTGVEFLRFVALSFGFIGIMRSFSGGFRGAGKTLVAAAIAVTTLGGIRVPIAWAASQNVLPTDFWFLGTVTPKGIWVAFFISNVAGALIAWLWFRRETWRDGDDRVADGDDIGMEDIEPRAASTDD